MLANMALGSRTGLGPGGNQQEQGHERAWAKLAPDTVRQKPREQLGRSRGQDVRGEAGEDGLGDAQAPGQGKSRKSQPQGDATFPPEATEWTRLWATLAPRGSTRGGSFLHAAQPATVGLSPPHPGPRGGQELRPPAPPFQQPELAHSRTGRGTLPVAGRTSSSARPSRGRQELPKRCSPVATRGQQRWTQASGPGRQSPRRASKAGEEVRQWRAGAGTGEGKRCPPVAGEGCSGRGVLCSSTGNSRTLGSQRGALGGRARLGLPGCRRGNRQRGVTGNCWHHTHMCLLTCAF